MGLHPFGTACYSWPQACSSIQWRCGDHDAILAQQCATIWQQRDHAPQGCATVEDMRTNTLGRHRDIHYAIIRFRHHVLLEKYKDAATSSEPIRILTTVKTLQQSRFLSGFRYGNSCSGLARHNTTMRKSRKFKMNGIYPRPGRTSVELAPQTSSRWTNTSSVFTNVNDSKRFTLAAKVCRASQQARRDKILPSAKSPITGKWSDRKNSQQQRTIDDNKPQMSQP